MQGLHLFCIGGTVTLARSTYLTLCNAAGLSLRATLDTLDDISELDEGNNVATIDNIQITDGAPGFCTGMTYIILC